MSTKSTMSNTITMDVTATALVHSQRRRFRQLLVAIACVVCATTSLAADRYAISTGQLMSDPAKAKSTVAIAAFPIAVWYPTARLAPGAPDPATPGAPNLPLADGAFPLILLSHGSGGSERGHRDWAEYLAGQGFVVAAPRHLGDSYDQPGGRGSDVQLIGRIWQAQQALDTVLGDARLGPHINAARIGMLGFSAGGYTTLVMAGAVPKFDLWKQHCEAHAAEDMELCPPVVWRALPLVTQPGWQLPPPETRIKAAVAMAPVAVFFDRAGLAGVHIPMRLYGASDDQQVRNRWNATPVAAALPQPVSVNLVAGGHMVFLAPCGDAMRQSWPALCTDAAGVDRAAIHQKMAEEIAAFFKDKL